MEKLTIIAAKSACILLHLGTYILNIDIDIGIAIFVNRIDRYRIEIEKCYWSITSSLRLRLSITDRYETPNQPIRDVYTWLHIFD